MSKTNYPGIDYSGLGSTANRDSETGIRYGIIPANDVGRAWYDSSEAQYGTPSCPKCGTGDAPAFVVSSDPSVPEADRGDNDYYCFVCLRTFEGGSCIPEEALDFTYGSEGYQLHQTHDDCDLWVTKSPYYTYAQFCSPCAPGAGCLRSPFEPKSPTDGNYRYLAEDAGFPKVYCLGHDWFEDSLAPYRVFSVETDEEVNAEVH